MCGATFAVGMSVLSTVMGGLSQKRQADAEAAAYKANAAVADNNAKLARAQAEDEVERGRFEEDRFRKDTAQLRGKQRTGISASGLDMAGSAAEVLSDTKAIEEEDAAIIRTNAQRKSWGFMNEGQNYKQQEENYFAAAKNKKAEGKSALAGSLLTAASQVGVQFASSKVPKIKQIQYPSPNPSDYQHWQRNGYKVQ